MSQRFRLLVLAGLLLLVTLPFVLGYALAGPSWEFSGLLLNPVDGHSYLAKMYQGAEGAWRFRLPYTSEPGEGAFIFLYYLALGHLANLTSLPLVFIFHLARLAGVIVMVSGLFRFFEATLGAVRRSAAAEGEQDQSTGVMLSTATLLGLFGSGLGWLVVFFGLMPSDIWVAEMYPFLSAYANPHFPLGLGLLVWLLVFNLQALNQQNEAQPVRLLLLAGLGLLLACAQPFGVVILAVILAGSVIWEWVVERRMPLHGILAGAASIGLGSFYLVYQYAAILADPVLSGWNTQNVTSSPQAWDFVLSLSPALLLAGFATWQLTRQDGQGRGVRLLLIWAVGGLVLAYLPFALQRRFLTGYFVPLAGLAAYGVVFLQQRWPNKKKIIRRLVIGLSVVSNSLVLLIGLFGILSHAPQFYLAEDELAVMGWLRKNSPADAVVLAGPELSLAIPSYTGRRVIYGHPFETVNAEREEQAVLDIYNGTSNKVSLEQFLAGREVDLIVYGARERALGGQPAFLNYPIVFQQGETLVFAARGTP